MGRQNFFYFFLNSYLFSIMLQSSDLFSFFCASNTPLYYYYLNNVIKILKIAGSRGPPSCWIINFHLNPNFYYYLDCVDMFIRFKLLIIYRENQSSNISGSKVHFEDPLYYQACYRLYWSYWFENLKFFVVHGFSNWNMQ